MFGCDLIEVCSFLMRSRKGVDGGGTGRTEELGGVEDAESVVRITVWKRNYSIKGELPPANIQ